MECNWKDEYVIFDSQNTEYKYPYGAVPCGKKITFKIEINNVTRRSFHFSSDR